MPKTATPKIKLLPYQTWVTTTVDLTCNRGYHASPAWKKLHKITSTFVEREIFDNFMNTQGASDIKIDGDMFQLSFSTSNSNDAEQTLRALSHLLLGGNT